MTKFAEVSEKTITASIAEAFMTELVEFTDSDVIIAGAGPSGLCAARETASAGYKTLLLERNNYLGGGFWLGGYLMNKVTFRAPAQKELDELDIPYTSPTKDLFLADGPHACSKLIAAACDAGVKILNMTSVDDVMVRSNNRVSGLVMNWSPVKHIPRQISCVDPVAVESRLVIDATGHEAVVVRCLEKRGLADVSGEGPMWVENSEDAVVESTGEVHPGLLATGMSVASVFGLPRMGPTFGSMLLSGKKAGKLACEMLKEKSSRATA